MMSTAAWKHVLWALIVWLATPCLTGWCEKPVYTSVKEAGITFELQGEYQGEFRSGRPWGAHVVARGGEKLSAVGYRGGLPGDGWEGKPGVQVEGAQVAGALTISTDDFVVNVNGKTMWLTRLDGEPLGSLEKVHRQSPSLGKDPPEDAIILFDGSAVDHWHDAKLVDGKYLGATNCYTKRAFQDHFIHLEFRIPFMPAHSGQHRGNSGVYVQRRYEIQVLDSFGLKPQATGCGAVYGLEKPKINMCFPPLAWQTYDIDFAAARFDSGGEKTKNARITVRHNGVLIHEELELPGQCPGQDSEGPMPGSLFLQRHGAPVLYRNIWVVEKPST